MRLEEMVRILSARSQRASFVAFGCLEYFVWSLGRCFPRLGATLAVALMT